MSDAPLPGPLDEFLEHPPRRPEPAELRGDILRRTTALVGRRRRARRLRAAAAVAAAIVVVAVTAWFASRPGHEQEPQLPDPGLTANSNDGPNFIPEPANPESQREAKPVAPPNTEKVPPSAIALEWQAFDAPRPQRAALYQQAGDRYYEEERDLASAVRCYGQAVQAAPTVEIDAKDNWLVMAMKLDEIERRKEK